MDIHNKLHYAGIALALGISSTALLHKPSPVHEAAVHQVQKPSRFDWPSVGQEKTEALGEALRGVSPGKVTIYCPAPSCHDLALDLDDAFQVAEWTAQFEERFVDSESENGIFVGPPGPDAEALKAALEKTTGFEVNIVPIDNIDGVGIIIGKTGTR